MIPANSGSTSPGRDGVGDVVHAPEQDEVRHPGRCEHVAVEPGEDRRAEAVVEETVSADALVGDGHRTVRGDGEPGGELLGPAAAGCVRRAGAVGDGTADRDDAHGGLGDERLDARRQHPAVQRFGGGRKAGGRGLVAGDDPAGPGDEVVPVAVVAYQVSRASDHPQRV
jgi:hypothetical protein